MRDLGKVARAIDAGLAYGMFQHRDEMLAFLAWLPDECVEGGVLEIGAHQGGSAVMWCELGAPRVASLDLPSGPWGGIGEGSADQRDAELSGRYKSVYRPLRGDSREAAMVELAYRQGPFGVVFIDGDHSYEGAKGDWYRYAPLVSSGGVAAFHDIADTVLHAERGVEVPRLWVELKQLGTLTAHEFVANREWGGIGALRGRP